MGTIVVYALIAIAVAAAIVALLVLVLPEERLSRPMPDVVPMGLPFDREVGADDLNRMRLPVAVRGYRMVDADAVFDRLSAEIERRDQEIAELRAAVAGSPRLLPAPPGSATGSGSSEPVAELPAPTPVAELPAPTPVPTPVPNSTPPSVPVSTPSLPARPPTVTGEPDE